MPYKKFRSGTGWKVWKLDNEGKKIGEPLSNKPLPEDKADAQVRALYASENKPKKELDTSQEELETKDMSEESMYTPFGGACSWDEMDALEASQEMSEKMQDMTYKFQSMARNIMSNPMMEDKAGALAELAKGYADRVKAPVEAEKEVLKQIAGDNQPEKPTYEKALEELSFSDWITSYYELADTGRMEL